MVLKVKEPVAEEYHRLREGLTLFTYLHLAADEPLTEELVGAQGHRHRLRDGAAALGRAAAALPDVRGGRLPGPAGRRARADEARRAAAGVLMGGVGGVANAKVVVLGARRRRPERREHRPRHGRRRHPARHRPRQAADDLLALRQPGARSSPRRRSPCSEQVMRGRHGHRRGPHPRGRAPPSSSPTSMVSQMKPGSVLVDVAIDQGGCFEDSHPTTHADPTYRGARLDLLLRGQHAGCGAQHLDLRADQRHPPVCREARRPRLARRAAVRPAPWRSASTRTTVHVTYAGVAEAHGMASVSLDEALS